MALKEMSNPIFSNNFILTLFLQNIIYNIRNEINPYSKVNIIQTINIPIQYLLFRD